MIYIFKKGFGKLKKHKFVGVSILKGGILKEVIKYTAFAVAVLIIVDLNTFAILN
jgi:hypothetical protein